jgi:hypothetical protein
MQNFGLHTKNNGDMKVIFKTKSDQGFPEVERKNIGRIKGEGRNAPSHMKALIPECQCTTRD